MPQDTNLKSCKKSWFPEKWGLISLTILAVNVEFAIWINNECVCRLRLVNWGKCVLGDSLCINCRMCADACADLQTWQKKNETFA